MRHARHFVFLALSWAWLWWWLNVGSGLGAASSFGRITIALGGISPALAALVLLYRHAGRLERAGFYRRIWDARKITPNMLAVIVLLPLAVLLMAIGITQLTGTEQSSFQIDPELFPTWWAVLPFALFVFILGPVPEEIGWRGYLLDALTDRYSGWKASVIIATVWSLWHLPLFFIEGYPLQESLGGSWRMAVYFALLFPLSIVYTWVYYRTGRSILAAILFHFFINFYGMTWETGPVADILMLILWSIAAIWATQKYPAILLKPQPQ